MDNKKMIIGIVAIVCLLTISFFISPKDETAKKENNSLSDDANVILTNAQKESESVKETEKKEFVSINVNDYLNYFNSPDQKLVLIGRPTCQYCEIAEPILHNIAFEYNIDIHYLNIDDFSEEDTTNLYHSDESFSEGFGTPTLLSVGNGGIQDKVDGLTDKAHYIEFLKLNEYIN